MNKEVFYKKVYCKYCKRFKSGNIGEYCFIPYEWGTYYIPLTINERNPKDLNRNNDCVYFIRNWIKQFKDFLEERRN